MGVLLGSLCAICIGVSDLFARVTMRKATVLATTVSLQLLAILTSGVAVLVFGGVFHSRDLIIGLVSGGGIGAGLLLYYAGLHRSTATIVSPTAAVVQAVITFGYAALRGEPPSRLASISAVVAGIGLLLVTVGGHGKAGNPRAGLMLGALSGLAYGFGFSIVIEAASDAGAWPALGQRLTAAVLLATLAVSRRGPLLPPRSTALTALAMGVIAGLSTISYVAGLRYDAAGAVVTASMFPATSVAGGYLAFRDPVSRRQLVGLAVVLIGIGGVAAG